MDKSFEPQAIEARIYQSWVILRHPVTDELQPALPLAKLPEAHYLPPHY